MTKRVRFCPLMLLALCAGVPASVAAPTATSLMPLPAAVTVNDGRLPFNGGIDVTWSGCRNALLDRAAERFLADIGRLTGMDVGHGQPTSLRISCKADDPSFLTIEAREGYGVKIDAQGITLDAEGPTGVLRGLATLRQVVEGSPGAFSLPMLEIEDRPRFAWRGVMIDTARHFISIPTLKRQLDAMEAVKLDVLHLHLSDNEGFRVESRLYPKLQEVGSHGQFYTQAEIRALVAYAADRGIRIVPEFDLPAHALALVSAYPELSASPLPSGGMSAAAAGVLLDPTSAKTYQFIDRLFGEMAALFPDRYFHVGGDEVIGMAWLANPAIQAFMKQQGFRSETDLEGYFESRVRTILKAHGKTVIGWEEIAAASPSSDVVVETWRNSNASATVTAKGNHIVVSAGYYLSNLETAAYYYAIDPYDPNAAGLTPGDMVAMRANPALAGLLSNPAVATLFPPVMTQMPPLSDKQRELILGGEAPLWGELVTDEMMDERLWPSAAALAERFWSSADAKDVSDMYRRLIVTQDELRRLGLEDRGNRDRMAVRLAAGPSAAVTAFAELVGSTCNNARMQKLFAAFFSGKPADASPSELNAIVDAAPSDSLVAQRFILDVNTYIAGDRDRGAELKARLACWRDNRIEFSRVAAGNPKLEAALPISENISKLSELGLAAISALEAGHPLAAADLAKGQALLDRQAAAENASSSEAAAFTLSEQPPADLLIAITPGIRALVEAAS